MADGTEDDVGEVAGSALESAASSVASFPPMRQQNHNCQPPRPAATEQVLAYLSRYTHRVAIANSRLISIADSKVSFSWKDYRHNSKAKVMTLDAEEFIRRFLLHSLPDSFHRIRHYGFLANGARSDKLDLCRKLLAVQHASTDREAAADPPRVNRDVSACPRCGGPMRRIDVVPRASEHNQPFRCDTS